MLSSEEITTFEDSVPSGGQSPYVAGHVPSREIKVVAYDPGWPAAYELLADLIRSSLGTAVLGLEHVGSTSVRGLAAKPVIDVDLTVADGSAESSYVPALEEAGLQLVIREPWCYGHRMLRHHDPRCNLHVWSPACPEAARHLIFRDWLRAHPDDRELYAQAKVAATQQTVTARGDVGIYNAHKQAVIREIYARAFAALGLIQRATRG